MLLLYLCIPTGGSTFLGAELVLLGLCPCYLDLKQDFGRICGLSLSLGNYVNWGHPTRWDWRPTIKTRRPCPEFSYNQTSPHFYKLVIRSLVLSAECRMTGRRVEVVDRSW